MKRRFSMIAAAILIMVPGFAACAQEEEAGLQNTSISQTSIQDDSGSYGSGQSDDQITSSIMDLLTKTGTSAQTEAQKTTPAQTEAQTTTPAQTESKTVEEPVTVYVEDEGDALISKDGIEVHITCYGYTNPTSMYLYLYAANDNDYDVRVFANNATVDGVPVKSVGFNVDANSESSDESKNIMFLRSDEDPEGSCAALQDPGKIEMDLEAYDFSTYDRMFTEHVTIDLSSFEVKYADYYNRDDKKDETDNNNDNNDDNNDDNYDDTSEIYYAPAYTPASYDFCSLNFGSSGQAVIDLQQRLTDLGYLCDKVDGIYGQNTATAVMSFNAQHGLDIIGEATPEMQELLYSSSAEYYVEPYIPLVIGPQFRSEHSPVADLDLGTVWVQVVNRSLERTVIGYELYYYQTDVYGDRYIEPSTGVELTMETTLQQTIRPGYIEYSDPISLIHWAWTYRVYVGIHKIVFDDGEVCEIDPDDITYFYLDIKS